MSVLENNLAELLKFFVAPATWLNNCLISDEHTGERRLVLAG
jgi:hypothetical protein